jgi:hypothetical protein
MKKNQLLIILFLFLIVNLALAEDFEDNPAVSTAGDIIQIAIPSSGYLATLFLGDKEGQYMFYKSFLVNTALTHSLKYIINRPRPEGNGNYAFPSGHTASAFQGAAFIERRYGWKWGIPSYLLASFVGYSRIEGESDMHDIWDVLGGAALGISTSYFFTDKYEENKLNVSIVSDDETYGLKFNLKF